MADEPKDPAPDKDEDKDPKPEPKMDTDEGKRALAAERKAAREAKTRADAAEAKLKELEDADKSELDKLRDDNARLTKDLGDQTTRADRLQVAIDKGLTAGQAKRLVGSTLEELEADADDLLETLPAAGTGDGSKPPPSRKPAPDLRGGGEPNEDPEEVDPLKLADNVPRP